MDPFHKQIDRSSRLAWWGSGVALLCLTVTLCIESSGGAHGRALEGRRVDREPEWQRLLDQAHQARKSGEPRRALLHFHAFVERFPENAFVHDAAFWIAQLRWELDGLRAAIRVLDQVAEDERSQWRDAAQVQRRRLTAAL